jgi:hypothetical protein
MNSVRIKGIHWRRIMACTNFHFICLATTPPVHGMESKSGDEKVRSETCTRALTCFLYYFFSALDVMYAFLLYEALDWIAGWCTRFCINHFRITTSSCSFNLAPLFCGCWTASNVIQKSDLANLYSSAVCFNQIKRQCTALARTVCRDSKYICAEYPFF